jgi:hypothetical protein
MDLCIKCRTDPAHPLYGARCENCWAFAQGGIVTRGGSAEQNTQRRQREMHAATIARPYHQIIGMAKIACSGDTRDVDAPDCEL